MWLPALFPTPRKLKGNPPYFPRFPTHISQPHFNLLDSLPEDHLDPGPVPPRMIGFATSMEPLFIKKAFFQCHTVLLKTLSVTLGFPPGAHLLQMDYVPTRLKTPLWTPARFPMKDSPRKRNPGPPRAPPGYTDLPPPLSVFLPHDVPFTRLSAFTPPPPALGDFFLGFLYVLAPALVFSFKALACP